MISPLEVYLVMQLNSIIGMFVFFAIVLGIITIVSFCQGASARDFKMDEYYGDGKEREIRAAAVRAKAPGWFKVAKLTLAGSVLAFGTAFLTPSSKTAAMMILIPKLTSAEVVEPVGREAKELYDLMKTALKKFAGDGETPTTTPTTTAPEEAK